MVEALDKAIDLFNRYPPVVRVVAAITLTFMAALVLLMIVLPRHNPESRTLFVKDINQLWQPLSDDLRRAKPPQKRLQLLGLTLYAAWGQLAPWIQENDMRDWEIDIYCLSPEAARGPFAALIPEQWAKDSEDKTRTINEFLHQNASDLEARNVKIRLHHYSSFPAVHGFLLGDGKIYMSLSHWSTKTPKLEYGPHPYEVVAADDDSGRAKAYREAFMNWLQRVRKG